MCRPTFIPATIMSVFLLVACSKKDMGVEPVLEPLTSVSGTIVLPDSLKLFPVLISYADGLGFVASSERLDSVVQIWLNPILIDTIPAGLTERYFSFEFPSARQSVEMLVAWVDFNGNREPDTQGEPIRLPFKFVDTKKSVLHYWQYLPSQDDFTIRVNTDENTTLRTIGATDLLFTFN